MNTFDKKYEAIACELVELLSKHGLAVEECKQVLNITESAYVRAANKTIISPADTCKQIMYPHFEI